VGIVTAATALTAVIQPIERRNIAARRSELPAFSSAVVAVFLYAGTMLTTLFLLSCLWRGLRTAT